MPTKKTTTDDVMRITKGSDVYVFNYEQWTCARVMWIQTGQRLGPIVSLFNDEHGTINDAVMRQLREILAAVAQNVLSLELNSDLAHGGAALSELFELVKSAWRLPYRHRIYSANTVRIGSKRVADFGTIDAPVVPRLGDVEAFRSAFEKLSAVSASDSLPVEFTVVGKRYLAERR